MVLTETHRLQAISGLVRCSARRHKASITSVVLPKPGGAEMKLSLWYTRPHSTARRDAGVTPAQA